MAKLKIWTWAFLLCSVSALALATNNASAASHDEMAHLFKGLEGHWIGEGSVRQTDFDGTQITHGYQMDLILSPDSLAADEVWNATTQLKFDTEMTGQNNVSFALNGDQLFVGGNGYWDPVNVSESTSSTLTYTLLRSEALTGRVYVMVFHQELNPTETELSGWTQIELNGMVISDEAFSARRW
ncbi:hypothetical protein WDW37_06230 [Bdellovibrionota bacterium FG-1]